ncbi:MAG: hypothetical protein IKJ35_03740 [Clostridia bacterium]|nr:hypothetical protein [Clostridia bacterium]
MKKISLLRIAFVGCTALAALLQLLALPLSHDPGTNYFQRGAILPILAIVFALLGAICGTVAACLTNAKDLNEFPFAKDLSPSPVTLGFLAVALVLVLKETSTLAKATAILMLLSALYEMLMGYPKTQRHTATVSLGLLSVIGMILLNAIYYFDARMEMNSPFKVSVQVGLLFAMLARTSELRYLVGRPQPRTLLILSSWAASIGAISALSLPASYALLRMGKLELPSPNLLLVYAAGGFLILCASISSLLRIRALLKKPVAAPMLEDAADVIPDDDAEPISEKESEAVCDDEVTPTEDSNRKDPT